MARQPVVSRTIKTFICECLVYDKKAEKNIKINVHLNRKYTDNKMLINACKKHITADYIFICVLSEPTLTEKKLFLTLDEFINLAHPVNEDPETKTTNKTGGKTNGSRSKK